MSQAKVHPDGEAEKGGGLEPPPLSPDDVTDLQSNGGGGTTNSQGEVRVERTVSNSAGEGIEEDEDEDDPTYLEYAKKFFPFKTGIWDWLPKYNMADSKGDFISGLSVGIMLVPQGMAHSSIATLPPIMGLYAALVPVIIYACLGSSRHLAPGSGALVALLVGSSLEKVPKPVALLGDGCGIGSHPVMSTLSFSQRQEPAFMADVLRFKGGLDYYCNRCMVSCWDNSVEAYRYDWVVMGQEAEYGWVSDLEQCVDLCLADSQINAALLLSLFSGVTLCAMALLNFGYVVNFFSGPVLTGFTCAGGVIIGLGQLKHLFGLDLEKFRGSCGDIFGEDTWSCSTPRAYVTFISFCNCLDTTTWETLLLGLSMILMLLAFKKYKPRWGKKKTPLFKTLKIVADFAALWVVLISTLVIYGAKPKNGDGTMRVDVVGTIPSGLPKPHIPDYFESSEIATLAIEGILIAMLSFLASMAVAWKFAKRDGYEVYPNQELASLGAACVAATFFVAFPIQGSLSRTAVNAQNGKTQLASLITATVVALALVAITSLLYYLPKTALAAIIIVAIRELIDYEAALLLKKRRQYSELLVFMIAFISTLIFGVLWGLLISVVCSIVQLVQRSTAPPIKELGKVKGHRVYRNVKLSYTQVMVNTVIVRFEGPLFFANSAFFRDRVFEIVAKAVQSRPDRISHVVMDASAISDIDSTALTMLSDLMGDLMKKDHKVLWSHLTARVRMAFFLGGLVKQLGKEAFFVDLHDAVNSVKPGSRAGANVFKAAGAAVLTGDSSPTQAMIRSMGQETEWLEQEDEFEGGGDKGAITRAATTVQRHVRGYFTRKEISPRDNEPEPATS